MVGERPLGRVNCLVRMGYKHLFISNHRPATGGVFWEMQRARYGKHDMAGATWQARHGRRDTAGAAHKRSTRVLAPPWNLQRVDILALLDMQVDHPRASICGARKTRRNTLSPDRHGLPTCAGLSCSSVVTATVAIDQQSAGFVGCAERAEVGRRRRRGRVGSWAHIAIRSRHP